MAVFASDLIYCLVPWNTRQPCLFTRQRASLMYCIAPLLSDILCHTQPIYTQRTHSVPAKTLPPNFNFLVSLGCRTRTPRQLANTTILLPVDVNRIFQWHYCHFILNGRCTTSMDFQHPIRSSKTRFAVVKLVYYSLYFIGVFFIYRGLPIAKI